jgi:MoaA/NifB/PqqE/SkfB family radical SAM enzyme
VPNQKIFCNTPWYELHIYWDGSLGICCSEDHKIYSADQHYNIATTSIAEWFNSDPVQEFRQKILKDNPLSACRRCYVEEQSGGNSRRINNNQKSVIFTRSAFEESFEQSPGRQHFDPSGLTTTHPIDLHIDLGNYCNLACKMCNPKASSTIASQQVKWGIESSRQYLGNDWTKDSKTWDSFKQQLLAIPGLNNIHFMGGETLLTDKFEDLVDAFIEHQRYELCFSFVTNGTVFKPHLIEKLKKFRRVGIEVSIETVDEHNAYQRQGTDTDKVLENIKKYLTYCNNSSITVALRPAVSALTIGYYVGLLKYALDQQLVVKSNLCYNPKYLYANILPKKVKEQYLLEYQELLHQLESVDIVNDYNTSDPHNYQKIVKQEATMCAGVLALPEPDNVNELLAQLVDHCRRWDQVYQLDARTLYPELSEIWDQYGY